MKRKGMRERVIALNKEHPDWSPQQVADEAGCNAAYVRNTVRMAGGKFPASPGVRQLGIAAMAEGLTLHDIRSFHLLRAIAARKSGEAA